jgi:hypothetical protein
MIRSVLLSAAALALSGCASQIMQGYVGRPVTDAIADYGPPTNAYDLPGGRRAFQWSRSTSVSWGGYNAQGNAMTYGAWTNAQAIGSAYSVSQTDTCYYTVQAEWRDPPGAWYIVSFTEPRFSCQ